MENYHQLICESHGSPCRGMALPRFLPLMGKGSFCPVMFLSTFIQPSPPHGRLLPWEKMLALPLCLLSLVVTTVFFLSATILAEFPQADDPLYILSLSNPWQGWNLPSMS